MKAPPRISLCIPWFGLLLWLAGAAPGLCADDLIAHYRFDTNGDDSLGTSPPFLVTNDDQSNLGGTGRTYIAVFKVTNAPFVKGVLYVDGRYEPNGHFVHYLSTAPIGVLRYDSFTISLDFYSKPGSSSTIMFLSPLEEKLESWTRGRYSRWRGLRANVWNTDNILTGGAYARWFGVNRSGGVLNVTLNNHAFRHRFEGVKVKPDRWHNVICSVDLHRRQILTMLDGRLLEAITLPADFKLDVDPAAEADREFTFADYSNGSVFYGYAANLKIFGRSLNGTELSDLYKRSVAELPKFAEKTFPWEMIQVVIAIFLFAFLSWLYRRRIVRLRAKAGVSPA
jgi:hypothetical protein